MVTVTIKTVELKAKENAFHLVGNGEQLMGSKELTRCKLYLGREV